MTLKRMKTTQVKPAEVRPRWYVLNADEQILGRLAAKIAPVLMGKHRPTYTPHVDTGDFVVVVNAEKVRLTGTKSINKEYDWYTKYQGGRHVLTFDQMVAKHPDRPIKLAVSRMLPKSKLGRKMLSKLKVYAGPEHPHQAQMPEPLEL